MRLFRAEAERTARRFSPFERSFETILTPQHKKISRLGQVANWVSLLPESSL
jgi:hypothetical protein